jgi:hypothetical protein
MKTRPSRGGFCTAIPSVEDPDVFLWAPTERDSEYMAAAEHIPLAIQQEDERVRMGREFREQEWAAYLKIRERV